MLIAQDTILDFASVTADKTSESVDLSNMWGVAFQASWTSSAAAGVIYVQLSNDGVVWTNHATSQAINNDNGSIIWNIEAPFYKYARVYADYTSGTILTLKATFFAKGF